MDGADKKRVIEELKSEFSGNFIDFDELDFESLALSDEALMNEYLETGSILDESIAKCIKKKSVFPCFSGSALKLEGVDEFLKGFLKYTKETSSFPVFGARVFKIAQDEKGKRLTFMKITGGSLKVKDTLKIGEKIEKVNEIRIYSGDKYRQVDTLEAGSVCAVLGLENTFSGQGLGFERDSEKLTAEPIFSYRVILPEKADVCKLQKIQP